MGFGKQGTGTIIRENVTTALGALAAQAAIDLTGEFLTEDFRDLKATGVVTVTGLTAGEGKGLQLYMTNGELTAAEMEEAVELNGPADRNDRLSQERAERWVRLVGTVSRMDPADTEAVFMNPEGGHILVVKPRWTFSNPEGWGWVIYNDGATLTTGASGLVKMTHYGVWVT